MLLLGFVATPQPVLANDEPLGAMTSPHFLYSSVAPGAILTGRDTAIIVEGGDGQRDGPRHRSAPTDARVDHRLQQIDDQIGGDEDHSQEQDGSLQHGDVAVDDRF